MALQHRRQYSNMHNYITARRDAALLSIRIKSGVSPSLLSFKRSSTCGDSFARRELLTEDPRKFNGPEDIRLDPASFIREKLISYPRLSADVIAYVKLPGYSFARRSTTFPPRGKSISPLALRINLNLQESYLTRFQLSLVIRARVIPEVYLSKFPKHVKHTASNPLQRDQRSLRLSLSRRKTLSRFYPSASLSRHCRFCTKAPCFFTERGYVLSVPRFRKPSRRDHLDRARARARART